MRSVSEPEIVRRAVGATGEEAARLCGMFIEASVLVRAEAVTMDFAVVKMVDREHFHVIRPYGGSVCWSSRGEIDCRDASGDRGTQDHSDRLFCE